MKNFINFSVVEVNLAFYSQVQMFSQIYDDNNKKHGLQTLSMMRVLVWPFISKS